MLYINLLFIIRIIESAIQSNLKIKIITPGYLKTPNLYYTGFRPFSLEVIQPRKLDYKQIILYHGTSQASRESGCSW